MSIQFIPLQNDVAGGPEYVLLVQRQTDGTWLILGVATPGKADLETISATGLLLSTAGVTDSTDKRFLTDAQLAALSIMVPLSSAAVEAQLLAVGSFLGADSLLASAAAVNLNQAGATTLYTVPAGKTAVITKVVIRLCSGNLTTASICFGFTGAGYNDWALTATHTELTGNTLYTVVYPKAGALIGATGGTFKALTSILQGAPMTATMDVYGYLF
jgi:hypothetical protein